MRQSLSQMNFDGDNFGDSDGVSYDEQSFLQMVSWTRVLAVIFIYGCKKYGQLGIWSLVATYIPQLAPVLRNKRIAWLSAGSEHALGIIDKGLVYSLGRGNHWHGQLGLGTAG
jgi:alpha-tubulin suppressor-like RCC1 family protein